MASLLFSMGAYGHTIAETDGYFDPREPERTVSVVRFRCFLYSAPRSVVTVRAGSNLLEFLSGETTTCLDQ